MNKHRKKKLTTVLIVILAIGLAVVCGIIILKIHEYAVGNSFYNNLRIGGIQP